MIGRPMMERASWIRETETRRRSTHRKLGGEQRERTDSRSGKPGSGTCARPTRTAGQPGGREREHDKLDGRRKRPSRAWSDEGQVRATVLGKRGRDELVLRGTAGRATSRKQTHGVGNQAMGESQSKLTAWRNHRGESVVGGGCRAGNRATNSSGQTHASGNRSVRRS
jgi:hypothetical protein